MNQKYFPIYQEQMQQFSCRMNPEVQKYIRNTACLFEQRGKSRTFFLVDDSQIKKDVLHILGYFTISLKVVEMPKDTSKTLLKQIDGLSATRRGKPIFNFPAFLIGQLAKNDFYADNITGSELLDLAILKLSECNKIVGGRLVVVECEKNEKLISFYKSKGFKDLHSIESDLHLMGLILKPFTDVKV